MDDSDDEEAGTGLPPALLSAVHFSSPVAPFPRRLRSSGNPEAWDEAEADYEAEQERLRERVVLW